MQIYKSLGTEKSNKLDTSLKKASLKTKLKKKKKVEEKLPEESKIIEEKANPYFKGTDTITPSFKGTKSMSGSGDLKSAISVESLKSELKKNKKK